jgi:hypothetical protein
MQGDVLDDPVALVEDADHGNALRHRGHAGRARRGCPRALGGGDRLVLLGAAIARRQPKREQQGKSPLHAYSGIHGS